ncbi:MAG: excinuclease ABC subunit A [Kiritimatiellia bacterium]|jgi:excinuclease ABC subunit A
MAEPTHIVVRGARVHNLQGIDVDVPRNALVVFTGVSGSGKSSLAFDTIYQEGQRRFVESLSSYARQFLGKMERPAVDRVEGVSPTLSIDQKTVNRNPRSTVGTITEIADHLRLLMARLGTPHCPVCHTPVSKLTTDSVVDDILEHLRGQKVQLLAPVVRDRKGEYRKQLQQLARDGWVRARVDGQVVSLDQEFELARYEKHTIEVVVDRLRPNLADRGRLAEAVETACGLSGGVVVALLDDGERTWSTERACIEHPDLAVPELEPRLFSFNAPQGACGECNGLGVLEDFELELLFDMKAPLPRAFRALNDEGRLPFSRLDVEVLRIVAKKIGANYRKKLCNWDADHLERLLFGDPDIVYRTRKVSDDGRVDDHERAWSGIVPVVRNVWKYTYHKGLQRFRRRTECESCGGARLNSMARSVTFRGLSVPQLLAMNIEASRRFFTDVRLTEAEAHIGRLLIQEICDRLDFLDDVGLGYIELNRSAATLSGGEAQRIRLAAQVGSALQGVTYVLDEPSIGLHARDNARLLQTLFRLRDRGNSVLVVEHDEETIRMADHVVDVGPGAGREGGQLVASTTPGRLARMKRGITAAYMRGDLRIEVPERRRTEHVDQLSVLGARLHNLKSVDLHLPLGCFVVLTGVSGSGKSTLLFRVLERSLRARLNREDGVSFGCDDLKGVDHIDKLVRVAQTPIGRTPRSNPATYTKAFDTIRDLFAGTAESRARGYKKGRVSFNVKGGRCEACQGAGVKIVEMQFLPSVQVPCEVCRGRRFNDETLEITYKGRTIHDVLELTCAEGFELFERVPRLKRILGTMVEVGLGYVPMGQPSTTLSGGEAQRVKLATELQRPSTGRTLYLLDEPTTGLHFHDVKALLSSMQRLVDLGNTVVVVEHHTDVIKCADHVIDLGPEGGHAGGQIVGVGTPEHIATLDTPTGRALAALPELANVSMVHEPVASRPRAAVRTESDVLRIEGARLHNLQGINVTIPHNKLTVVTGVSGSGKTSLAFDTIFAEGQRRYVESLSTYARRFLGRVERAPVELIEGLKPAIAIDQKAASKNPRSTVATVTEIHDVLRVLWARIGLAHCPVCDRRVHGRSPSEGAAWLASVDAGTGWLRTKLRASDRPAERRSALLQEGWARVYDLQAQAEVALTDDAAERLLAQGAWLVLDRLNPGRSPRARLSEAIRQGYLLGSGQVTFQARRSGDEHVCTELATCSDHGPTIGEQPIPRHFSFNSRLGACVSCDGLGRTRQLLPARLFPNQSGGFWDAIDGRVAGVLRRSARNQALVAAALSKLGVTEAESVSSWTPATWDGVMGGIAGPLSLEWTKSWGRSKRTVKEQREWIGLRALLQTWNASLDWLMAEDVCPDCSGGRLQPGLLAVRIEGRGLHEFVWLSVDDAIETLRGWRLEGERAVIAERAVQELDRRLSFLSDVGLGYLSLDRSARTLSGGESQRIRLASQLGSMLTGVIYVLDEPTVGLHPRDTDRLLCTLEGLRDLGNTVVVVEHDPDTIHRADYVIDLGPGAGRHGGHVLAAGTPQELMACPSSITGRWLSGVDRIAPRETRREARSYMRLRGARAHNLKNVSVDFPTGVWTAITGVSGSGKSTLVMDTLAIGVANILGKQAIAAEHDDFVLDEVIHKLVVVDQSPIGRTPRSTPATYCKIMDALRKLFAQTLAAKERGWGPGRFSFNAKSGRCATCEGRGAILVEMHFLPDVWVVCEACRGRRYSRETLGARWKGHSIADVLAMRADEAVELFQNHRSLRRRVQALVDVGLGYLELGQPATTLSGGEAQRVKLAAELTSRAGHCLYVLDEPTTGLHLADVADLVAVLHRLVDQGHSVITIEHNLQMVQQADHVIDMGPEGGEAGGRVVAQGTPEQVAAGSTHTGRALHSMN